MGSKGSTRVDAPDPFAVAEADALFNRIDQYTPLSSLQFFGPQRNQMVETLNPALQHAENQRLLSDIGLNNMALSRQAEMKGGSLPSLTPHLQPGAQQEFFGLPTSLVSGTDAPIAPPQVPDFIGDFQGGGGGGGAPGGGGPTPGGNPGGLGSFQGYDPRVRNEVDAWTQKWYGKDLNYLNEFAKYDPSAAISKVTANSPIGKALGIDGLFGGDKPKRGSLPGTLWETDAQGNILGNKGTGHYNPYLGMWVDRRGRPVQNQQPPPEGYGPQAQQAPAGGAPTGGALPPQPQMSTGLQAPQPGTFGAMQGMQGAPTASAKGGQMQQMAGAQQQAAGMQQAQGMPQTQAADMWQGGPQQQMAQQPQGSNGSYFGGTIGGLFGPDSFGLDPQGINRGRVEQAMFDRSRSLMQPMFDQQQQRMQQDLAARGIPRDSEAGNREISNFMRNRDEQYTRLAQDAIMGGGAEVRNQQAAMGQLFGMGERLAERDIMTQLQNANMAQSNRATQFNELASLLGLNQVAQPGLQNFFAPGQVDVGGAFALNQQAQTTNANNATAQKTGMMDAIGGLGGAGMMMSDRRLKKNIERIGTINGYPLYSFDYIWGEPSWGVMSDEVPEEFVTRGSDGYDRVDYRRIF